MRRIGAVLCALAALSLSGCSTCANDFVSESLSPDGKHKAVVFVRSCGATTGYGTHVSVMRAIEKVGDDVGNAFTADDNHGKVQLGSAHQLPLRVQWTGGNSMLIRYPERSRLFRSELRVAQVAVTYLAVPDRELSARVSSRESYRCTR